MTAIETVVGPAQVLHRLALGVEPVDAILNRRADEPVLVGREVDPRRGGTPRYPLVALAASGPGRYRLDRSVPLPVRIRLRVDDPSRRFVPRRFDVALWLPAETDGVDATPTTGTLVPVASRLLRPWLLPGAAAQPSAGATVIRGRVVRTVAGQAEPVRWARIRAATGDEDTLVGWTHGDERGEFLLVVTGTGTQSAPDSTMDVRLRVVAPPRPAGPPDPKDRLADLVVEAVPGRPRRRMSRIWTTSCCGVWPTRPDTPRRRQ